MSEEEQTLEEKILSLRQQGLKDEEAIREIFREDLNADVNEICRVTGLEKLVVGRIKGQISRWLKRQEEKGEEGKEAPHEGLYKTEPDANAILDEILSTHPEITPKIKAEIMDWAKRRGSLDPGFLAWLLSSFRGMTQTTANVVSQKYALALQRAQQEGRIQLPMGFPMWPPQQQPLWSFPGFPQQQQTVTSLPQQPPTGVPPLGTQQPPTYPSWPPQPAYPPTQQDVRTIFREEMRAFKEPREAEAYVDIEEPVRDAEGKVIIGPDDRAIVKRMHVPASQASQLIAPKEDVEMRVLEKLGKYKELFGSKEELTTEKIRAIIRDEIPTPTVGKEEKPITVEDVKAASSEAAQTVAKQVLEAHEKEDKEERRHRELLSAVREGTSTKTVEGYKEDSFRILGQGLSEAAGVVREKKPIEVLVREGGPLVLGVSPPKEVESGAGGLIDRLKKRGWVVEQ